MLKKITIVEAQAMISFNVAHMHECYRHRLELDAPEISEERRDQIIKSVELDVLKGIAAVAGAAKATGYADPVKQLQIAVDAAYPPTGA